MANVKKSGKTEKPSKPKSKLITLPEIFPEAGFSTIKSDGIHFDIEDRTGEIDYIFAFENVIVLCEETTATNNISNHFSKKKLFHGILTNNKDEFFETYCSLNDEFKKYVTDKNYDCQDLEIRHIYFSSAAECDHSLFSHSTPLQIMRRSDANYFKSLTKIIGKSAKYELLKYLNVSLSQIGDAKSSGAKYSLSGYDAFTLSGTHTNYPSGFGIVSFYADPASLISRAYVLRRDGWEDSQISYQRFLVPGKLSSMRSYLADTKKVFVNNLIVTLPNHVQITDHNNASVDLSTTYKGTTKLVLPNELGTVGIVDGQHRVFSYHEGDDDAEKQIKTLRKRQNLLVTGIVFPSSYSDVQRAKFEAELFLSINNTQTSVKADLRQELEALINPSSTIAVSKAVISKLAKSGPLAGLLQEGLYDPPEKIRTSSLVRYVLPSLIKTDASGSLYQHFSPDGASNLEDDGERIKYIEYCHEKINYVLLALRTRLKDKWKPKRRGESGLLSPTSIGGFLLMLRDVVSTYNDPFDFDFEKQLSGVEAFDFSTYTSSAWAQLGASLSATYFDC
ncbi:DNA sulfur modification protein DndB [Burkholderia vietnamiensis]|uniref:DNA sulfur modification protein DndB n=1 Tax=Burkholderia vietnamiensis TaxID=60552 RepID=UPI00159493CB|nr:DNA sulfur modification protein DndB [Burkholderia vietnamiensis]WHU92681.1 DNA sulfur modification protein DndB [Burkholderia vietnamiensis]